MTSESLRSQVEKRIAEQLVTPSDILTWRIEWWDDSSTDKTISQFMADKINEKAKA